MNIEKYLPAIQEAATDIAARISHGIPAVRARFEQAQEKFAAMVREDQPEMDDASVSGFAAAMLDGVGMLVDATLQHHLAADHANINTLEALAADGAPLPPRTPPAANDG